MKTLIIIHKALILVSVLFYTSCSESLIDKPLQPGTQSDVSFRQTAVGLLGTLNTAYSQLAGSQWQQYPLTWLIMGEYRTDDAHYGGESDNDGVSGHAIGDFNIYSTNSDFETFWRTCYNGIHYANAVIYSAPGALAIAEPADVALINFYVGQAKCLRAWYYFDLVRQFGDVPLVLDASLAFVPRTNRLLVYDQIEKDLTEAAALLPKAKDLKPEDKGRMNSGSALAILAKVYLFRASIEPGKENDNFTKAYTAAKQVITDPKQFSLLPSYDKIWSNTGDFSTEGIVEGGQPAPEITSTAASYWYGIAQSPRYYYQLKTKKKSASGYGWGMNCPTQDFVNDFEKGDPRLHWTVYFPGDSAVHGNTKGIKQQICFDNSVTGYYLKKYTPDYLRTSMDNALNLKFYRYSDLLLVGAEAANEINKTTDALDWLEQVRARARKTPPAPNHKSAADYITGVPEKITTTDQGMLRSIIRHERRIELGCEAHRFYDLVRWDGTFGFDWRNRIATAQILPGPNYEVDLEADGKPDAKSGLPRVGRTVLVEQKHKLSPIPDADIRSAGGTLTQNEGY